MFKIYRELSFKDLGFWQRKTKGVWRVKQLVFFKVRFINIGGSEVRNLNIILGVDNSNGKNQRNEKLELLTTSKNKNTNF